MSADIDVVLEKIKESGHFSLVFVNPTFIIYFIVDNGFSSRKLQIWTDSVFWLFFSLEHDHRWRNRKMLT